MARDELVFLPLGGSGEIGMNMNLYGFGPRGKRDWVMIDCGVMFGDLATPGVDLICPDASYILERKDRLKALLLTHGHEDHIGAVGHLWDRLECPIYATPFTAHVLRGKLAEAGLLEEAEVTEVPMSGRFTVGPFELELRGQCRRQTWKSPIPL